MVSLLFLLYKFAYLEVLVLCIIPILSSIVKELLLYKLVLSLCFLGLSEVPNAAPQSIFSMYHSKDNADDS